MLGKGKQRQLKRGRLAARNFERTRFRKGLVDWRSVRRGWMTARHYKLNVASACLIRQ